MRMFAAALIAALLTAGCGDGVRTSFSLEETGTIEEGDEIDANFGDYRFDSFDFQVSPMDVVTVDIEAEGFDPLVSLREVSTGAELGQWDPAFSGDSLLRYRVAAGGTCQARIYAMGDGTGTYTVRITVGDD